MCISVTLVVGGVAQSGLARSIRFISFLISVAYVLLAPDILPAYRNVLIDIVTIFSIAGGCY